MRNLLLVAASCLVLSPFTAAAEDAGKPAAGAPLKSFAPVGVATAAAPAPARTPYGAKIAGTEAIGLEKVLADADKLAGKTVLIEADVKTACSKKGCWMELGAGEGRKARVTFKDYGFFVPLDSAGSRARVEGVVEVKKLEKKDVEHYESEGGKIADKAADGTAREVRIVASGVELWRPTGS